MSSDEEEVVVVGGRGKRSALNKTAGRNRMRTLTEDSSDDNDDLFADSDVDENGDGDEQAEFSYSSDSLKKALTRLKGCLDPPLPFDEANMTSWASVEAAISKKQTKVQELGQVVNDISTSTTLSLEFKCMVALVAAQTCQIYKAANDPKNCQQFFKTKDKDSKSKHVANFVSNVWLQESSEVLQSMTAPVAESNMHIRVIQYGLRFIESAFVIDNGKRLNVLKEKQNIDWLALVDQVVKLSSSKKLSQLGQSARSTQKYLASFLSPQSADATAASASSNKADDAAEADKVPRKLSLQDIAAKKREERMANMKRKAQSTSIRRTSATTGGLTSMLAAQASGGLAQAPIPRASARSVPAQASGGTWGTTTQAQASGGTWGTTTQEASSSGDTTWGTTQTSTAQTSTSTWGTSDPKPEPPKGWNRKLECKEYEYERPPPKPVVRDFPPPRSRRPGQPTQDMAGIYGPSSGSRSEGAEPPPVSAASSNYNQGSAWAGGSGENQSLAIPSNDVGVGARGSGVWGDSSSNNVATISQHDNQSVAGGGYAATDAGDSKKRPYIDYSSDSKRPRGNNDRNFPPRDAPPATGAGRGRGRGQTLPAWMTAQGNSDGPQAASGGAPPHAAPPSYGASSGTARGFNDAGRGRGRGKDMNLPAWMTDNGGPQAPPSQPNQGGPPPAQPMQGGFPDAGGGGGGRGRGRGRDVNLPAWMTQNNNV